MGGGGRRAATAAALGRWCLVILAVASALGVSGPAFYWRYKKGFSSSSSSPASTAAVAASSPSCPPCSCDCPAPLSLKSIAPGELSCSVPLTRSCYCRRLVCVGAHATHNLLDNKKKISILVSTRVIRFSICDSVSLYELWYN